MLQRHTFNYALLFVWKWQQLWLCTTSRRFFWGGTAALRGCGVSFPRGIPNPPGYVPVSPALGDPAWAGELHWVISRGPFQLYCSVICSSLSMSAAVANLPFLIHHRNHGITHPPSVSCLPIISVPVICTFKKKCHHYPCIILPQVPLTEDIDFCVVEFLYCFHQEKYCNQSHVSPCTVYFPSLKFHWTVIITVY